MRIEEAERIANESVEEMKCRFKKDMLLMGATIEEAEQELQRVYGKKDIKAQMMDEMKKAYPSLDEYCTGKYFQAREVKTEEPKFTKTDWYKINGVSRADFL